VSQRTGRERVAEARSFLFVPGTRPDRFARASASGAGVVIVDLEDAVSQSDKVPARNAAAAWLKSAGEAVVRINSDRETASADLGSLAGLPGLLGVMIPKSDDAAAVAHVVACVGPVAVIPLIESALGLSIVRELAAVPDTCRLALGSLDLALDLGIGETSAAMASAGFELVMASRLAGLPAPISSVTTEVGDGSAAGVDASRSRAEGFGAKLCIHPDQVAAVNGAFRPSADEIRWASRVVGAEQGSVGLVDGAMVDRPVVERAQRILTEAKMSGDRSGP
jgi:citrate lyase subunit beta/citryl-CoA lyase